MNGLILDGNEFLRDNSRQWSMLFDASAEAVTKLNTEMKLDPVVIRHGIIKLANKLEDKVPDAVSKERAYKAVMLKQID